MKVYIALGINHYDGDTILGVYSTEDGATKCCMNDYLSSSRCGYDEYEVEDYDLDA